MKCTILRLHLIPDDGFSSINSDHRGLDKHCLTGFLAEEGCHKYAIGLGPSILQRFFTH